MSGLRPLRIALLRAVNVGGTGKLSMAALRAFAEGLGLANVVTLLQSGNLVFASDTKPLDLEHLLEREAEKRLHLKTDFFVRAAKEWQTIVAQNPFPAEAKREPARFALMPLRTAPAADQVKALEAAITGPERIGVVGRTLYAIYPERMGQSRLTNRVIETKLDTRCTARNWNTVLKLAALAEKGG